MIGGPVVPRASKLSTTPPLAGQRVRGGERLGAAEARLLGVGEDDDDVVAQLRPRGQRAHRLQQRRHPGARRRRRRGRSPPSRGGPSGTAGRSSRCPGRTRDDVADPGHLGRRRARTAEAPTAFCTRVSRPRPVRVATRSLDDAVVGLAAGDVGLGGDLLHVREGAAALNCVAGASARRGRRRLQRGDAPGRRGRAAGRRATRPARRPGAPVAPRGPLGGHVGLLGTPGRTASP